LPWPCRCCAARSCRRCRPCPLNGGRA
jgi:hypothetical protein